MLVWLRFRHKTRSIQFVVYTTEYVLMTQIEQYISFVNIQDVQKIEDGKYQKLR